MSTRIRETDGDIVAATRAMYAAYGDRSAFDDHLHADVTIWESDQPDNLMDLSDLDALRDSRSEASAGTRPTLTVHHAVVDRWADTAAVIRYVLRADSAGTVMQFRVTDVLVGPDRLDPDDGSARSAAGWRIVHHHAEQLTVGEKAGDSETTPGADTADDG